MPRKKVVIERLTVQSVKTGRGVGIAKLPNDRNGFQIAFVRPLKPEYLTKSGKVKTLANSCIEGDNIVTTVILSRDAINCLDTLFERRGEWDK